MKIKTIVVNLYAGPGAGKSVGAWEIAAKLKKENINTEYVAEYAKELVWDNEMELLDGSIKNQKNVVNGAVAVAFSQSPEALGKALPATY